MMRSSRRRDNRRPTATSWSSDNRGFVERFHSRRGIMVWSDFLPAPTALASGIAPLFAVADTRYTSAAILSIYAE